MAHFELGLGKRRQSAVCKGKHPSALVNLVINSRCDKQFIQSLKLNQTNLIFNRSISFNIPYNYCMFPQLLNGNVTIELTCLYVWQTIFGEMWWCSSESSFQPLQPGFDSLTRHHKWVQFDAGSLLSLPGSLFLFPQTQCSK